MKSNKSTASFRFSSQRTALLFVEWWRDEVKDSLSYVTVDGDKATLRNSHQGEELQFLQLARCYNSAVMRAAEDQERK